MNKKSIIALAAVATFAAAGTASLSAAPYGAAGCGLGSIVFGDKPGFVQVFAATTNATSASQTFGITSGTSNCSGAGAFKKQEQETFAAVNMKSLEIEMAAGKGEKLDALSNLMGCPVEKSADFGKFTKANYKQLSAANSSPSEFISLIKVNMAGDAVLGAVCKS